MAIYKTQPIAYECEAAKQNWQELVTMRNRDIKLRISAGASNQQLAGEYGVTPSYISKLRRENDEVTQ